MQNEAVLRVAGVVPASIEDGPGYRYVLFVQGCPHNCPGCHNPHTHDPGSGYDMEIEGIISEITKNPLLDGITLSGGEPFLQAEKLAYLAERVRSMGLNVVTYTGYTFEELLRSGKSGQLSLLEATDILIDGRFVQMLKSLDTPFRGSRNQRLLDVPASLKEKMAVEWILPIFCEYYPENSGLPQ